MDAEIIINETGKVLKKTVPNKSPEEYTLADKELLRILELVPAWEPGVCDKKKVTSKTYIRINF